MNLTAFDTKVFSQLVTMGSCDIAGAGKRLCQNFLGMKQHGNHFTVAGMAIMLDYL